MKIETMQVDGQEALAKLEELRAEYFVSGKYPFFTDIEKWSLPNEMERRNESDAAKIIEKSLSINALEWFEERADDFKRYALEDKDFPMSGDADEETDIVGEWRESANAARKEDIMGHKEILTQKIKPIVYIGLVEIEKPWMLPAAVKFGGWNDCPKDKVHCAVLRYWLEKYNAEPVTLTRDVIECWVEKPPQTKEDAIELAWQQYYYCTDIVEQGCGEVMELAGSLKNAASWFFWWD